MNEKILVLILLLSTTIRTYAKSNNESWEWYKATGTYYKIYGFDKDGNKKVFDQVKSPWNDGGIDEADHCKREDGWVLVRKYFGSPADPSDLEYNPIFPGGQYIEIPHFILYNQITGILRAFYYHPGLSSTALYTAAGLAQSDYTVVSNITSHKNLFDLKPKEDTAHLSTNIWTTAKSQKSYKWLVNDFQTTYDPESFCDLDAFKNGFSPRRHKLNVKYFDVAKSSTQSVTDGVSIETEDPDQSRYLPSIDTSTYEWDFDTTPGNVLHTQVIDFGLSQNELRKRFDKLKEFGKQNSLFESLALIKMNEFFPPEYELSNKFAKKSNLKTRDNSTSLTFENTTFSNPWFRDNFFSAPYHFEYKAENLYSEWSWDRIKSSFIKASEKKISNWGLELLTDALLSSDLYSYAVGAVLKSFGIENEPPKPTITYSREVTSGSITQSMTPETIQFYTPGSYDDLSRIDSKDTDLQILNDYHKPLGVLALKKTPTLFSQRYRTLIESSDFNPAQFYDDELDDPDNIFTFTWEGLYLRSFRLEDDLFDLFHFNETAGLSNFDISYSLEIDYDIKQSDADWLVDDPLKELAMHYLKAYENKISKNFDFILGNIDYNFEDYLKVKSLKTNFTKVKEQKYFIKKISQGYTKRSHDGLAKRYFTQDYWRAESDESSIKLNFRITADYTNCKGEVKKVEYYCSTKPKIVNSSNYIQLKENFFSESITQKNCLKNHSADRMINNSESIDINLNNIDNSELIYEVNQNGSVILTPSFKVKSTSNKTFKVRLND